MATAASDEKQVVEIVPAAPDPDPEQQQARDVTAPGAYYSGELGMETMEALPSELQPLLARMSQLLGPAGPHPVDPGDTRRRCLAVMETEVSIIAEVWRTLRQQPSDKVENKKLLEDASRDTTFAEHVLHHLVGSSRQTLLQRATQWFHRRKSHSHFPSIYMVPLYYINEQPDLGLTPQQLTKAGPLVGIDRPAKKILRWLSQSQQGTMDANPRVICIVGPAGIGKTTLAMELHDRLRHETRRGLCYFQCIVMARASQGTDRNIRLLQDILKQVSPAATASSSSDPSQANTTENLADLVSENLRDKRYFLIIDDICDVSDWYEIFRAVRARYGVNNLGLGSRILITTRSTMIAEACWSSFGGLVHQMKPLNEMDSQRLLAKAVGSKDGCLPDNMKLFCDEILRRCNGIPLFIIGMADWLKEHERFAIAKHYEEQVLQLPERLEQALSSAFNDLPNHDSRLILLYMSMFPYGHKFDKYRLMLKWEQERIFKRPDFHNAMYQLLDRNAITCAASKCSHHQENEAEACQWQVNHFMHHFLASKSAEMGLIFTTTTSNLLAPVATDRGNKTRSRMPRRLALHHPDPVLPSLLGTMDLSLTRSLAVSGTVSGIPLHRFANLVVLDFEGWENLNNEDLLHVCRSKMFFLRYLSVRNTRVSKLPHEIMELQILYSLDISYTQITELPLEVFKLRLLRNLDARCTQITHLPKQIVGLQNQLASLLVGGEGAINSVQTATRLPHDVRHLHELQTLATVDLTQHPASVVRALGDLSKLAVLAVTWSFHLSNDRDYCEALLSSIAKWKKLESLTIHCGFGCSMEFLGSLEKFCAPDELKKFKVKAGRFASVPPWIYRTLWTNEHDHLAFIQITVCNKQTTTDDLNILGALRELKCLILGLDFIPGQPIVIGNEGFYMLERFSVDCPMPWLTFSTGAMRKLTYLQLKFCSTPSRHICVPSGISNLGRLTEVALSYNVHYINSLSIKMTVEAVTKQVAEHCNPIDLFINGIELEDVQEADDEVTENTIGALSRTNAGAEDVAQAVGEEATVAVQCEITEAES